MPDISWAGGITAGAGFVYTLGFSAGLYETVTVMPNWFTDPPRSFLQIRSRGDQVQKFWIPVQIGTTVLLGAAVVSTWDHPARRTYVLVALACYLIALLSTVMWFLKKVRYFMNVAADAPNDRRLTAEGLRWHRLSWIRTALPAVGAVCLMIGALGNG